MNQDTIKTSQVSRFKDVIASGSATETTLKEMIECDYIHQVIMDSNSDDLSSFYRFVVKKHKALDEYTQDQRKKGVSFQDLDSSYSTLLVYFNLIDLLKDIMFKHHNLKV